MRHARNERRLSRPTGARSALLCNLTTSLVRYGKVQTTVSKAKEVQRVADRLITLAKEGSVHSRRRAYRVLKDRTMVKRLFADVAPEFLQYRGGYTRVVKLPPRRGDGAALAMLELTHRAVETPTVSEKPRVAKPPSAEGASRGTKRAEPAEETPQKPKGFFEGLRGLFEPKKRRES